MTRVNSTLKWAENIANEYNVPIKTVIEIYVAIGKFEHNERKVRNTIETGFLEGSMKDGRDSKRRDSEC